MNMYFSSAIILWFLSGIIGGYRVNKEMYEIRGEYPGLTFDALIWILKMSLFGPFQLEPLSQEIKDQMKNGRD